MKKTFALFISFIVSFQFMNAQTQPTPTLYTHKVVVDSVIQAKAYTYIKAHEKIKEKDSSQWIALPHVEAKVGSTYYFNKGLQMGEFQSKELNRTFTQILFLGALGTNPEVSDKNIIPSPIQETLPKDTIPHVIHTVEVKQVLQAGGYTYLRANEGDKEEWIAIVRIPAQVGQIYTYDDASPIQDFTSKELKRTFKEVLFVAKLTLVSSPESASNNSSDKKNKHAPKLVTISQLLENKKYYSEKIVKISGRITKYSPSILNQNWIHIEDGTNYAGKFDLTLTTDKTAKVGDNITVVGKISLDKNFGSGYFFDIIMEDAVIQNK